MMSFRIRINAEDVIRRIVYFVFNATVNGFLAWLVYRDLRRGDYPFGIALAVFWILMGIDRVLDKLAEAK